MVLRTPAFCLGGLLALTPAALAAEVSGALVHGCERVILDRRS